VAVERKLMIAEDLLALPDDGMRHELIEGEVRCMAPAGGPHGNEGWRFVTHLSGYIAADDVGEGFLAETGFLLRRDPDTVRAPDFAFIRRERMPADGLERGYVTVPPDLVLEVVSTGDSATEVREKVQAWLDFGVGAVWVLYQAPRLDVFRSDGTARSYGPNDEVDGGEALPGFRMTLGAMLGLSR
jgi:Uma2 family endonuclease